MTAPVLEIDIVGVKEANELLTMARREPSSAFDACVSMVDVGACWRPPYLSDIPHVLALEFDDDYEHEEHPMQPAQADMIVAFLRGILTMRAGDPGPQRWLIHCHAGMSRSTAVALALLWLARPRPKDLLDMLGRDAEELAQGLVRLRPKAIPNLHMVTLLEDALGLDGLGLDGERFDRVLTDAARRVHVRATWTGAALLKQQISEKD